MLEKFLFCWVRGVHVLFILWMVNIAMGLLILSLRWCTDKIEIMESPIISLSLGVFLLLILFGLPPIFYLLCHFCGIRLDSWHSEEVGD